VAAHLQVFVVGAAIREPMSQTRIAAVVVGSGLQPRFEEQDRASQITARLIRNGQAHHAMRVEFPARFFNRLARITKGKQGSDDLSDPDFRSAPVISNPAPRMSRSVTLPTNLRCPVSSTTGCVAEA